MVNRRAPQRMKGIPSKSRGKNRTEISEYPWIATSLGGKTLHAHQGEAGGEGLQQGVGGVGCGRQQAALNGDQQCDGGAT